MCYVVEQVFKKSWKHISNYVDLNFLLLQSVSILH